MKMVETKRGWRKEVLRRKFDLDNEVELVGRLKNKIEARNGTGKKYIRKH